MHSTYPFHRRPFLKACLVKWGLSSTQWQLCGKLLLVLLDSILPPSFLSTEDTTGVVSWSIKETMTVPKLKCIVLSQKCQVTSRLFIRYGFKQFSTPKCAKGRWFSKGFKLRQTGCPLTLLDGLKRVVRLDEFYGVGYFLALQNVIAETEVGDGQLEDFVIPRWALLEYGTCWNRKSSMCQYNHSRITNEEWDDNGNGWWSSKLMKRGNGLM